MFLVLALTSASLAAFFWVKVRERDRLLDQFTDEALAGVPRQDVDAVVMALSRQIYSRTNHGIPRARLAWYDRWESTSFFNVTTGTSLKLGIYGIEGHSQFGPCGTMSRVLLNALWRLGVPARKLQLLEDPARGFVNHTMVEYESRGSWHVISPSDSSFTWRDAGGDIASVEEIRSDPAIFAQVHRWRSYWPASFERVRHIRWEKLPQPVRSTFRLVLGPEGYEHAETPRLYDQPRHLLMWGFGIATGLFAALALLVRPGSRPAAHA
jgi:hypothetical protein